MNIYIYIIYIHKWFPMASNRPHSHHTAILRGWRYLTLLNRPSETKWKLPEWARNLMRAFVVQYVSDICRVLVEPQTLCSRPCFPNPRPWDRPHCIPLDLICEFRVWMRPELAWGPEVLKKYVSQIDVSIILRIVVETLSNRRTIKWKCPSYSMYAKPTLYVWYSHFVNMYVTFVSYAWQMLTLRDQQLNYM